MEEKLVSTEVEFLYTPVINFAMQQNYVPAVRKLFIRNNSDEDLQNLEVQIIPEPAFASPWQKQLDLIQKDEGLDLGVVNFRVSAQYLSELTEKISGSLTLIIKTQNEVLFTETYDIDILAFDQWAGINVLPEVLGAFVTPNHQEIPKIIKCAAAILNNWTGSPSFDEYQTRNPDRVKKQMAAIYEAIAERQIIYCTVPASFEESGQRIRIADIIFEQKIANCLDLSLLYAACLEAVGIHPIIVIIKGHAFAGAWLAKDCFTDTVNDDPSLLTKRLAEGINEICVVEATCMNAGQKASFDEACRCANNHFIKEDDFLLFIDIARARYSSIRPLPLRIKKLNGWEFIEDKPVERKSEAPSAITEGFKLTSAGKIDVSKQRLWERKLLDLSLRNNLLNLRIRKGTIQLISVALSELEDGLASGEEFQILPKPVDWDNPLRNAGVYQSINQSDPIIDLVRHELSQKRLRSYLSENELSHSLVNLYRSSKVSLEENGANTLYIALGLLKWYETNLSERPRFAPILLIPVEIVRKSAQKGYVIRSREEDTVMNITLLEMLRQDWGINIGGLEKLPKDDNGVDVKLIFNIIRQAIMSKSRWDVEEQAFIGNFSFNKFIMWNDIHSNADKLTENKIVSSLVAGKIEWNLDGWANEPNDFDRAYHPADIALPISADSSQLQAICAASAGQSFVLHGPPGTGKSQTITNIIANALYQGKKVLFVAEKMAALSVVQSRLESIGLSPFCLELHSNKMKKSAVLEQLKRTTEIARTIPPQEFASEAERLHQLRSDLNDYVEALHKIYPFDLSLYDCFTAYAQFVTTPDKISFDISAIEKLDKEKLNSWDDIAEELHTAGRICGSPHEHPLKEIKLQQYVPSQKTAAIDLLARYQQSLHQFKNKTDEVIQTLQLNIKLEQENQYKQLKDICSSLLTLPNIPANLLATENLEQSLNQIVDLAEHDEQRDALKNKLLKAYDHAILVFDAALQLKEWQTAEAKWFLLKMLKQRSVIKALKKLSTSGKPAKETVINTLEAIIQYQAEQQIIEKNEGFLASTLGFLWRNDSCEWQKIKIICPKLKALNRETGALLKSPASLRQWRQAMVNSFAEGSDMFLSINGDLIESYLEIYKEVKAAEANLSDLLKIDFLEIISKNGNWLDNALHYAKKWQDNIEGLKDWTVWQQIRTKAIDAGLSPLVIPYESGLLESDDPVASYKKGLYRSCAEFILGQDIHLSSFNGQLFEDKIERFRTLSKQFEQLTIEELYARLASKIPSFTQEAVQSAENGILQKAIRNGGRGVSIRKLFDSIANILQRMCPCMLMSPISVAQYFEAGPAKFDLVIFDEASQMPTCEAVGAIARGTSLIVVGDPKQMPPTNFFSSNRIDEDNIDKEDLESILDDCLALSMPSNHLLWHYRSKHESLIAFSNSKYYDNKLLTFPSPDDIKTKVNYVAVKGYYDRAKTRQNDAEATAIVNEIIQRLDDPILSERSIGVVTFSSVQQILIDDMLNNVLKTRPDLEAKIIEAREPLFIKNLENVQGDERDVILFSVGYGPDKEGKVSLNFGPLNRDGGWRRLNVAVSRARYEMKVFSTLRADQIDITRTASEGVAGLKAFLEYAEKGKVVLEYHNPSKAVRPNAFIKLLASEIKKLGYEINTNIGCSGYRIDIGIINPAQPAEYLLGILCDGPNYKAAKTARDREIVQVNVLKALGWSICKVWSTDWWENAEKVMQRIYDSINEAQYNKAHQPEHKEHVVNIEMPAEPMILNNMATAFAPTVPETNVNEAVYETCELEIVTSSSSEDFLLGINQQRIIKQIKQVIEKEAPITKNLLCKRILSAWGISRLGTRIAAHFEKLFQQLQVPQTNNDGTIVFWHPEQNPATYDVYRVPDDHFQKREADDLPPEEVANAIKELLKNQISLPEDDLIRETAKIFGFARVGNNVQQAIIKGLSLAIKKTYALKDNDRITLNETPDQ